MKLNIEIKKGNVIKIDDTPVYVVCEIAFETTSYNSTEVYVGYSNSKLYKIRVTKDLYYEENIKIDSEIICENIQNLDNILKAF